MRRTRKPRRRRPSEATTRRSALWFEVEVDARGGRHRGADLPCEAENRAHRLGLSTQPHLASSYTVPCVYQIAPDVFGYFTSPATVTNEQVTGDIFLTDALYPSPWAPTSMYMDFPDGTVIE